MVQGILNRLDGGFTKVPHTDRLTDVLQNPQSARMIERTSIVPFAAFASGFEAKLSGGRLSARFCRLYGHSRLAVL